MFISEARFSRSAPHGTSLVSTRRSTSLQVSASFPACFSHVWRRSHGFTSIVNPPFVYGKLIKGLGASLSSNIQIYQLIAGQAGRPLPPQLPPYYCNVYDVARAHVLALKLPKLPVDSDVQEKRFIVAGPGVLLWEDAVGVLMEARPALKDRLPSVENAPPLPGPLCKVDTTRAQEVLGMNEYKGWRETLLETVDAIVDLENTSMTKPRY